MLDCKLDVSWFRDLSTFDLIMTILQSNYIQQLWFVFNLQPHIWPCGLMDKASDFESEDCRFESCHGRWLFLWIFILIFDYCKNLWFTQIPSDLYLIIWRGRSTNFLKPKIFISWETMKAEKSYFKQNLVILLEK
jgi:hypothetical protein